MTDTFPGRVRQAIADPGSIVDRNVNPNADRGRETMEGVTDWTARAVLQIVNEHRYDLAEQVEGRVNPIAVAVLLAFYGLAVFACGLWIGAVWL